MIGAIILSLHMEKGIVKTIHITKKLGTPTKHPKVLACYDFHHGIFNKKEDLMFATKP
jgi:hypothetical protein